MIENQTNNDAKKAILLGVVILFLVAGGLFWKFNQNPVVPAIQPENQLTNNQIQTTMTIDPQAQELINQFNELAGKISQAGKTGNPNEADMAIFKQLSTISDSLSKYDTAESSVALSVNSYGYDVNVNINGKDVGKINSGSTNKRLFFKDSIMYHVSTPDIQDHNFVLNKGENSIVVSYKKVGDRGPLDEVDVKIINAGQSVQILKAVDEEGRAEKTFVAETINPENN